MYHILLNYAIPSIPCPPGKLLIIRQNSGEKCYLFCEALLDNPIWSPQDTSCFSFLLLPGMTSVTWYHNDVFAWLCAPRSMRPFRVGFFFPGLFLYPLHLSQWLTHSQCKINVWLDFGEWVIKYLVIVLILFIYLVIYKEIIKCLLWNSFVRYPDSYTV